MATAIVYRREGHGVKRGMDCLFDFTGVDRYNDVKQWLRVKHEVAMADFIFLVENNTKAEMIRALAGEFIEVLVVAECPATYGISPQGQGSGSVFAFQAIPSVWSSVATKLAGFADVYYCFDTSMEGEYLSYLIDKLLVADPGTIKRHRLHLAGFTAEIVQKSLALLEPLNETRCVQHLQHDLFHKVFFSHLGRLLGTTMGPGHVELSISALTLLALLADKQQSIASVVPQPRWEVEVRFVQDGGEVCGRLSEMYGVTSDGFLDTGTEAKEVAESVKGVMFESGDRSEAELLFPCPTLYTLPELVLDAYRFYQIMPGDVLSGLETLFSGVDTAHGRLGLITSPHGVSSQNMRPVFKVLGQYVTEQHGDMANLKNDFGEGVILPVDPAYLPQDMDLTTVLQQIYGLIWSRSVASQMNDAVACDRKVMFEKDGRRIQFSSLILEQEGFLTVFKYGYERVFDDAPAVDRAAASVVLTAAMVQQHKVKSTSHYQVASLCEDMREMGFDDEKQLLVLFQHLLDQHYITLGGCGEVMCTDVLFKVTRTVDRAFPRMKGLNLSAYYAQTLEEVMSGRKRVDVALKQFDQNLVMQGVPLVKVKIPAALPKVKRKSSNVIKGGQGGSGSAQAISEGFADFDSKVSEPAVVESGDVEAIITPAPEEHDVEDVLPKVEAEVPEEPVLEVVVGEADPCEDVEPEEVAGAEVEPEVEENVNVEPPNDIFTEPEEPEEQAEEEPLSPVSDALEETVITSTVETKDCPECGRAMVVKDDRFGKFWACTGLPACHYSESFQKTTEDKEAQSCPVCKRGSLSVNRTPAGKDMYICTDPSCEFMAWAKPHAIACPLCASPFLVQKKDRSGNISLRCPMAGCSYIHGSGVEDDTPPKKKKVRVRRKKAGSGGGKKRRVVRRRKK